MVTSFLRTTQMGIAKNHEGPDLRMAVVVKPPCPMHVVLIGLRLRTTHASSRCSLSTPHNPVPGAGNPFTTLPMASLTYTYIYNANLEATPQNRQNNSQLPGLSTYVAGFQCNCVKYPIPRPGRSTTMYVPRATLGASSWEPR